MKQRIITGLILGAAALGAILFLPNMLFGLLLLLVAIIGVTEWANFLQLTGQPKRLYIGGGVIILASIAALPLFYPDFNYAPWISPIAAFWLLMPFALAVHSRQPLPQLTGQVFLFVMSILSLAGLLIALIQLHKVSIAYLLYLIGLIIIADSGAYFVGRSFGKRKLAPTISPGKTIEGALGGILLGMVFAAIFAILQGFSLGRVVNFVALSLILVIVSISGDLFESVVKRHCGMKDSGTILPGHGGVLDRIDALTAAAPLFLVGLQFL